MWTLENIQASNICAFREFNYSLQQGHTTLIFGNNLDNDSQGSNGSGKSALIEAIAIALTGDSLRKIKADEIINDAADEAVIIASLRNNETSDTFIIKRTLSRNNPQKIETILNDSPEEQANVNEYNKAILNRLGLTKDDILSNYILSKHKYSSFLSASDRDKKDLINRFSNGSMVDESIEVLHTDISKIKQEYLEAEKEVAKHQGKIDAINEQIATVQLEYQAKANRRDEIIAAHEEAIARARGRIREAKSSIKNLEDQLDKQDKIDESLRELEESAVISIKDAYTKAIELLSNITAKPRIKDYDAESTSLLRNLSEQRSKSKSIQKQLEECEKDVAKATKFHAELAEELSQTEASHVPITKQIKSHIDESQRIISEIEANKCKVRKTISEVTLEMANIDKLLAGTIECPNCHHNFILETDHSIESLKQQQISLTRKLKRAQKFDGEYDSQIQEADSDIQRGRKELREMTDKCDSLANKVREALSQLNNLQNTHLSLSKAATAIKRQVSNIENDIFTLRQSLFDDAFDILDATTRQTESQIEQLEVNISTWEGNIESYQAALEETLNTSITSTVEYLETTKSDYSKYLNEALSHKESVEQALSELIAQETRFIDFKTHLANSKIEALAQMTNEFLCAIGSDLRIAFSGYTVLKSGKIRDKISISVLRDGIDCGSFAKMSQGEQCRANLASILALHKLTNVNCPDGKGLDLLILDEILDATDEAGLANMFDALNALRITSMVVSHGLVHESYPYRLTVTKQNGVSTLNENTR